MAKMDAEDRKDHGRDEATEDKNGKKLSRADAEDLKDGGKDEASEDKNGKKLPVKKKATSQKDNAKAAFLAKAAFGKKF